MALKIDPTNLRATRKANCYITKIIFLNKSILSHIFVEVNHNLTITKMIFYT